MITLKKEAAKVNGPFVIFVPENHLYHFVVAPRRQEIYILML